MRIAVVTGHYIPEMGYWEVQIARALHAEDHDVKVFSSKELPPRARNKGIPPYRNGRGQDGGIDLERLPHRFALNQVVVPKGLKKAVENYGPDLVIAIGIGKLFPEPVLLPPSERSFRLAALFGNNRFNYRKASLQAAQKHLVQRWVKDSHYERAVRNCDRLWSYTPETKEVLREFVRPQLHEVLEKKHRNTAMGFDPDTFYFDPEERRNCRQELGIGTEELLFVTATRPIPSKRLEEVLEDFETLFQKVPRAHYLLIGSTGTAHDRKLEERMGRSAWAEHFHVLPFQPEAETRRYFSAADIGVWTVASISIQKAMGTGLPILLPESPSLSHLLDEKLSGSYYREGEFLAALKEAAQRYQLREEERKDLAKKNRERLSDRVIVRDIVERSMEEDAELS